ncbi:histone acetyltransferase Hpa2p [Monosporozyma unispora]|nr:D-amino-acid N-acetyltransferase [Kazachstania unispora]
MTETFKVVNDDIIIRYVTKDDKEAWSKLWKGFQAHYEIKAPNGIEDINFPKFLDPNVKMWSALAIDTKRDKAIGMVNFLSRHSTWDLTEIIYLNDLYVDENERVKGVGRSLIEFVYEEADKMGTPHVYWTTDHFNHRAQMLYTKVSNLTTKVIYRRHGY